MQNKNEGPLLKKIVKNSKAVIALNQACGPAKAAQAGTAPVSLGSFWSWMSQDGSVMGLQPLVRSTLNFMRKRGGPFTCILKYHSIQ